MQANQKASTSYAETLEQACSQLETTTLRGVDHLAPEHAPEAVATALQDFLNRHAPTKTVGTARK
jgi:hypothetical protein